MRRLLSKRGASITTPSGPTARWPIVRRSNLPRSLGVLASQGSLALTRVLTLTQNPETLQSRFVCSGFPGQVTSLRDYFAVVVAGRVNLAGGNMRAQRGFHADLSIPAIRIRARSSEFGPIQKPCQERVPPSASHLNRSGSIGSENDVNRCSFDDPRLVSRMRRTVWFPFPHHQ